MAPPKKTLYQILGVPRDANPVDIGLAHEMRSAELERRVPPDPSAAALVQQAFEILSNPARRAVYDAQLVTAAEKSAAAEQATPDLEIGEEEAPARKLPVIPIAIGLVVVIVAAYFVMRPAPAPKPEAVAEAPKPAPPPAPKTREASEIIADVATSAGQLLSYSMSGSAEPIGMALGTELGTMVTTCHGIPAGGKLVVRVGKEQHPADLAITDETFDLCRLSLPGFTTPPLKVATDEPRAGDKIFEVAFNAKGELAATEGTIKALKSTPNGIVLEISTPIAGNASGAGIFDRYGKLVGIGTTPHAYGAGLQVALPAAWLGRMRSRAAPAK
jgi:serine protease Do